MDPYAISFSALITAPIVIIEPKIEKVQVQKNLPEGILCSLLQNNSYVLYYFLTAGGVAILSGLCFSSSKETFGAVPFFCKALFSSAAGAFI